MPTTHQDVTHLEVIEAMRRYGGGFVAHLAEAWARADDENNHRLLAAFPGYYEQYRIMAIGEKARGAR